MQSDDLSCKQKTVKPPVRRAVFKGVRMGDGWKVLRGGRGNPPDGMPGASSADGGEKNRQTGDSGPDRGAVDRYGASPEHDETGERLFGRYGENAYAPEPEQTREEPVPRKHWVIAFCVLGLVFLGWVFKDEVRGVAAWAVTAVQGKEVPLSAKAPGLARVFRFNKPYTWDEFLVVCREGKAESVRRILDKQPELMRGPDGAPLLRALILNGASPDVLIEAGRRTDDAAMTARDVEGGTLLHAMASGGVDPAVLQALRGKDARQWINARDAAGKTALHVAAGSGASAGLVLAFRGMGADPCLRDNTGRTPLDCLLETWGGMPRAVTPEERKKFPKFGYSVPVPFSRTRDGKMETKFVSIAEQVGDIEGKRYFSLFAESHIMARESGFPVPDVAGGDQVGPPPNPEAELFRSIGKDPMERMREQNRHKGEPLWKSIRLQSGTGAAMAKCKSLLPEAYPWSVNYFSGLLTGAAGEPSFDAEWDAWDVPGPVRLALMMQMLQDRLQKTRPRTNTPGGFALGGNNLMADAMQTYRERGDAPQARHPLLMVWTLLEYDKPAKKDLAALNLSPAPPGKKEKEEDKDKQSKELPNLRALHAQLPPDVWRAVGRYLVAAAYVSEKNQDGQWGGGMMPSAIQKAGGMHALRLWGNEDGPNEAGPDGLGQGEAEPLRRVIALSGAVREDLAVAMTALILRSGPRSAARGKDGLTPLEYAGSIPGVTVPERVKAMLRAAPVYMPPEEAAPGNPAPRSGRSAGGVPAMI